MKKYRPLLLLPSSLIQALYGRYDAPDEFDPGYRIYPVGSPVEPDILVNDSRISSFVGDRDRETHQLRPRLQHGAGVFPDRRFPFPRPSADYAVGATPCQDHHILTETDIDKTATYLFPDSRAETIE